MQTSLPKPLYTAFSYATWPGLFIMCAGITAYGFHIQQPLIFFNLAYAFLAVSLLVLERVMPHETAWQNNDGQIFADIAHTLTSKGTVQTMIVFSGALGLADFAAAHIMGFEIWPHHWPMIVQVGLGLVLAEFMLYWAHRLGHEVLPLWFFHAVHHSVTRLWVVNTGRFHFVDSLISIALGMSIPVLIGAPADILQWIGAITAFIGMLTHCNVDVRTGPISYVFNTPELHRWHHSKDLREGNMNYGENLVIWDQVFGTFFREPWRRPPVDIGISEAMPRTFKDQIAWPFRRIAAQVIDKARQTG